MSQGRKQLSPDLKTNNHAPMSARHGVYCLPIGMTSIGHLLNFQSIIECFAINPLIDTSFNSLRACSINGIFWDIELLASMCTRLPPSQECRKAFYRYWKVLFNNLTFISIAKSLNISPLCVLNIFVLPGPAFATHLD